MCLAQEHNTVTPVRLERAAPRSQVKHSTTEPLCSYPHTCKESVPNLNICEKMESNHHMWKNGVKTHTCEGTKSLHIICEILVHSLSQMSMTKLWRIGIECKMQQICVCVMGWGGVFINVRNTHVCYIKFDSMRIFHKVWDIGTKYMWTDNILHVFFSTHHYSLILHDHILKKKKMTSAIP